MKGFDAEFRDLDHYIRVITDRIWEGRRFEDIRRYYGEHCAVETPSSVSIGIEPVIAGTQATLAAFPDRRLLAEDVIVSGDEDRGFLSSHRIFSPMVHAGDGVFGPPTGRAVCVRTVADCVCIGNRIVHEWLVRDQAAVARQIGLGERALAQRWLDAAGGWHKPAMPPAPAPYRTTLDDSPMARTWADAMAAAWQGRGPGTDSHDTKVVAWLPGGEAAAGLPALGAFWRGLATALPGAGFAIEHLALQPRAGRATAGTMRWRVRADHAGPGRYGPPTGRPVEVMGISHAEFEAGRIVREWHLIDDVATWMQVLEPRRGQGG
jgi:predicted ester cyclase